MFKLADFKKKRVLIVGLGLHGGGVGSAEFFTRLGGRVVVTDLKSKRELAPSVARLERFKSITYRLGGHRPEDFKNADYVIKGPGVPEDSRFIKMAKRSGVPVLSDVEVFFRACPAPIIGITGTKGKSTTATLLARMLQKKMGMVKHQRSCLFRHTEGWGRVWLGGNIRKSVLTFLRRIRSNDLVVLELSSFQLDSLKNSRLSPHIALITNIFPDHLNRYPSMRVYAASKATIFRYQRRGDVLFINDRDAMLRRLAKRAPWRVVRFDPRRAIAPFRRDISSKSVPDFHLPNVAAAIAVARHLGVGEHAIRKVLRDFRGVPNRMQVVRRLGDTEFINDTTATNPEAARQAIVATKRRIGAGRLVVIAGGYDKGLPVGGFVEALARRAEAVVFLPGTATRKMKQRLQREQKGQRPRVREAWTMEQAVRSAYRSAERGGTVLLSPGAASFGLFKHEFDRGEQFVKAARRLTK